MCESLFPIQICFKLNWHIDLEANRKQPNCQCCHKWWCDFPAVVIMVDNALMIFKTSPVQTNACSDESKPKRLRWSDAMSPDVRFFPIASFSIVDLRDVSSKQFSVVVKSLSEAQKTQRIRVYCMEPIRFSIFDFSVRVKNAWNWLSAMHQSSFKASYTAKS